VNGKTVNRLPAFVDPETDRITVDGRPIPPPQRPVYVMLNKPARVLATTNDETGIGRTTIMDLIDHPARARLFPVGRLDFETTGLVLLTNDGELANRLTHPRFGVPKTYQAEVKGTLDEVGLAALQRALIKQQRKDDKRTQRETGRVRPSPAGASRMSLSIVGREPGRTVIHITLREGRTGNIAKMLAGAGANVRKLERIAIGPVLLTGVAGGRWRELERHELRALRAAAEGKASSAAVPRVPSARKTGEGRRRPGATPAGTQDHLKPAVETVQTRDPRPNPAAREPTPRRKPRTIS
jgi:pseudouridine synthase